MFVTKKAVSLQHFFREKLVSSSSLVRTSGFHPGNSGSNPGETTKKTGVSSSSLVRTSGFHPGNSGSNPGETTN